MKKKFIPVTIVITVLIITTLYFEVFRFIGKNNSRIEGSGTIEVTEVDISSKISGRVSKLPKAEGMYVKKGTLVVKLEYDELAAQKYSALANYSNASNNLKRIKKLYKSGSVSKKEYDNMLALYKVAKANVRLVSAGIDNAVIYSPLNGVVLDSNLEVGEMAFPGTSILTIADLKKPWINIYVNEKKLGFVRIGQNAEVTIDSFPNKKFNAKVVAISNKAEFTPKTIQTKEERVKLVFAVKLSIENPDQQLKPGMPADAVILTEGIKQ